MTLIAEDVGYVYAPGTGFAVRALEGVSLEVAPGGLVLVLGRTGSGKSTLLRLLAGLAAPGSGTVSADGGPSSGPGAHGLVGMVFQDPEAQLFADTVLEDVAFGPRNLGRGDAEAIADAEIAMDGVGLPPDLFGARSPFTLSGGEARRAALAGVIAMRPRYLVLDEPSAGLDASGRRSVAAAVQRARDDGVGAVIVSHDAEEWLGVADDVLVLDGGRVALHEAAEKVIAHSDSLAGAGLRAPEVLRAWALAAARGIDPGAPTLDPLVLAEALAAGRRT